MSYDALTPVCEFNEFAGFESRNRTIDDPDVLFQMDLIEEEFEELVGAVEERDLTETLDGIADVIVTCAGLCHRLGVDPNDLMKAINDSNASKFCYDALEAHESVSAYANDERYTDVRAVVQGDVYVIMGRKVGGSDRLKILKGINYQPPVLKNLIKGRV